MANDLNQHDRFVLRQRIRPVVNQYEFTLPPAEDGQTGAVVCFVEQKRFRLKEDIRFYADDSKATELFRIKARQRFDPRARYDVTDSAGATIGEIQKAFGESLLRSTYRMYGADGDETATVTERSAGVAIARRLAGIVPYGDLMPIPYHFVFQRGERVLGTHSRVSFQFRDTYRIDMTGDPERSLDRRLVLAMAVGLDALQAR